MKKKFIQFWRWIFLSKKTREMIYVFENWVTVEQKRIDSYFSFVKDYSQCYVSNRDAMPEGMWDSFEAIKQSIFIEENAEKFIYFRLQYNGVLYKAAIWKDKKTGELKFSIPEIGGEKQLQADKPL